VDFLKTRTEREPADEDYCRSVEAYLCRKNDGHLMRIVGPAFERVCAWADRGVPLKVAYRGIDRYFERYYAKGPRRRPVRIEFCEADVMDVFDEWRRAVGVLVARERPAGEDADASAAPAEPADDAGEGRDTPARSRRTLAAHLDRVVARLSARRVDGDPVPDEGLDGTLRELEALRGGARTLRGAARQAALDRLRALDGELLAQARDRLDDPAVQEIRREADAELAPFRTRMPADAYARATAACIDRIIRERARLPTLAFE
jgi:hypothetical protein